MCFVLICVPNNVYITIRTCVSRCQGDPGPTGLPGLDGAPGQPVSGCNCATLDLRPPASSNMHTYMRCCAHTMHRVLWEWKDRKEIKETEELGCVAICVCMKEYSTSSTEQVFRSRGGH